MWTSLNKRVYLFFLIIFLIGITSSIIIFKNIDDFYIENIENYISDLSNTNSIYFFNHFIILSIIIVSLYLFMGAFTSILYIFYKGISTGFLFLLLFKAYSVSGIIFGLIYFIIMKLINIILIFIFCKTIIKNTVYLFKYLILKEKNLKEMNLLLFKKIIICLIFIIINDVFLYFCGNSIVNIFSFLVN